MIALSPWRFERRDRTGYAGTLLWASDDDPMPVLHAFIAPGGGFGLGFRDATHRRLFEAGGEMYAILALVARTPGPHGPGSLPVQAQQLLARIDGKVVP